MNIMVEVINQTKMDHYMGNICVMCENLDYHKRDYDSLCYKHKRKLLWG